MTHWRNGKKVGGAPTGEAHPKAKLSKTDIQLIRTLYQFGLSKSDIARKFDTPYSTISDIVEYRRRHTD